VIYILAFIANGTTEHFGAETPNTSTALRRPYPSLSVGMSWTPNLHRFRINQCVSVHITCFHVISVHIERGIRVPFPSRVESSDNRVPSNSCRCHLWFLWWPSNPGGCKDGTPNRRVSARFRFCPGRSQATSTRIGWVTPHSFFRREGTIDTIVPVEPGYRRYPFG